MKRYVYTVIKVILLVAIIFMMLQLTKGLSAMAAAPATECKPYNARTTYVICVDVSAQVGSVRSASRGVVGPKVIPTFTVTTSRVDSGAGDSLTLQGHYVVYGSQAKTSSGLKYYMQFGIGAHSDQGLHYYPSVGPRFDSHGCVRLTMATAKSIWNLLVAGPGGNMVQKGVVEIHIFP